MNLTAKGRYAVMAVVDLCLQTMHNQDVPISLSSISVRQNISIRYLEQLFLKLRNAGIVTSIRGAGGGYLLAKEASGVNIEEIIRAVGEEIQITRCKNKEGSDGCLEQGLFCVTHDIWVGVSENISKYLESITMQDICNDYITKKVKSRNIVHNKSNA